MNSNGQLRTYVPEECAVFRVTTATYGGLSNMAGGFPLFVNETTIWSSEALYQACRFPLAPDIQEIVLAERSAMTAKMKSKKYRREHTRPDWDTIKVKLMKWCLRVKLAQNWQRFGEVLRSTGDKPIVEESRKDDFWGAKRSEDGKLLIGMNGWKRTAHPSGVLQSIQDNCARSGFSYSYHGSQHAHGTRAHPSILSRVVVDREIVDSY